MDYQEYIQESFPTHETDGRMRDTPKNAVRNLRALHHEIIRLSLMGFKNSEIADYLKLSMPTISNCLNSEKGRHLLQLLVQKRSESAVELQHRMMENAPVVHDVLLNFILDEDQPRDKRAKEAREYMGLCGFVKPQRIQAQTITTHLTLDEIEQIKARARQRAAHANVVSDAGSEDEGMGLIDLDGHNGESINVGPQ